VSRTAPVLPLLRDAQLRTNGENKEARVGDNLDIAHAFTVPTVRLK
jgi:hypothetical protein